MLSSNIFLIKDTIEDLKVFRIHCNRFDGMRR